MKELTHSKLEKFILNKIKGATFISARTETKQSTLNKGRGVKAMVEIIDVNPDDIVKHTDLVFLISGGNVSYQDFVNNRLLKEAVVKGKEKSQLTFESGEHKWGKLLHDGCNALLTHRKNGGRYLIAYCVANTKPKVKHTYLGESIDLTEARFDTYQKPTRKDGDNQGTENPIAIRDYNFNSIKEITILKETYKVIPDPA